MTKKLLLPELRSTVNLEGSSCSPGVMAKATEALLYIEMTQAAGGLTIGEFC